MQTLFQEKAFFYGERRQNLGVLTLPDVKEWKTPRALLVLLNSGLVHREGPYRVNVRIARELAKLGFATLRIDLSGKGDSPAREGLSNRESVAKDWEEVLTAVERQLQIDNIVLMGLCSGADNAIKLVASDERIKGLMLLDPLVPRDSMFMLRQILMKMANVKRLIRLPIILLSQLRRKNLSEEENLGLRDLPLPAEFDQAIRLISERGGAILSIFTGYAFAYYNKQGQFAKVSKLPGFDRLCKEVYWPQVMHTYTSEKHRAQLIETIFQWSKSDYLPRLSSASDK